MDAIVKAKNSIKFQLNNATKPKIDKQKIKIGKPGS